jgi:hypothetical protein
MPRKKKPVWTTRQGTTRIIPDATVFYQRNTIPQVQHLSAFFALFNVSVVLRTSHQPVRTEDQMLERCGRSCLIVTTSDPTQHAVYAL